MQSVDRVRRLDRSVIHVRLDLGRLAPGGLDTSIHGRGGDDDVIVPMSTTVLEREITCSRARCMTSLS